MEKSKVIRWVGDGFIINYIPEEYEIKNKLRDISERFPLDLYWNRNIQDIFNEIRYYKNEYEVFDWKFDGYSFEEFQKVEFSDFELLNMDIYIFRHDYIVVDKSDSTNDIRRLYFEFEEIYNRHVPNNYKFHNLFDFDEIYVYRNTSEFFYYWTYVKDINMHPRFKNLIEKSKNVGDIINGIPTSGIKPRGSEIEKSQRRKRSFMGHGDGF